MDNEQKQKERKVSELQLGKKYDVTVLKVNKNGIIVKLTDGSTQFIHISKISTKYVDDINKYVQVGKTYTAVAVEGSQRDIELSLLDLHLEPIYSDDYAVESMEDVLKYMNFSYEDKFEGMPYRRTKKGKKKYAENIWDI